MLSLNIRLMYTSCSEALSTPPIAVVNLMDPRSECSPTVVRPRQGGPVPSVPECVYPDNRQEHDLQGSITNRRVYNHPTTT